MFLIASILLFFTVSSVLSSNFTISESSFLLNGSPIILRSGSLHYSRIPPSLWEDRLDRMKAMGLNAVQFYVPWNYHEVDFEGKEYKFEGDRDVIRFIKVSAGVMYEEAKVTR